MAKLPDVFLARAYQFLAHADRVYCNAVLKLKFPTRHVVLERLKDDETSLKVRAHLLLFSSIERWPALACANMSWHGSPSS